VFPEEKFGSLEMPGEVYSREEEEDVSDPPTVIMPERQYHREPAKVAPETGPFGDLLWPFW
jgi:hypothetical protein